MIAINSLQARYRAQSADRYQLLAAPYLSLPDLVSRPGTGMLGYFKVIRLKLLRIVV